MEYRTLGRTGMKVSAIGLGCEGFTGKTANEVRDDFSFASSLGINFFDCYSSDPELRSNFGAALAGRREKFIIQGHLCSSWENGQYLRTRDMAKTRAAFDDLLTRMGTDVIDVGMIHYSDSADDLRQILEGEIIQYAVSLKEQGKIRAIGLSSHNPQVAAAAVKSGLIDVLMFSVNPCYDLQPADEDVERLWADESYEKPLENMDKDREALYELCERLGVGIDVMKVFGGGDLLDAQNSPFGRAFTPVQCIEYALSRPAVASVMAGCRTQEQIRAAAAWCDAGREERDFSPVMRGLDRFTWTGHCMYCGHCAPCPKGIHVASVTKFLNLARAQASVPETVREHYLLLPHHASECIACGACETRCPFGVDIRGNMREAAALFGR
jgi:predicted aldo/keto reductase-like oxidoreductase